MGDLIAWKTAEEVIKLITAENAMVAGMTIEEAAKALGYTLTKSGMYVKTVTTATSTVGAGVTAGEAIAGTAATGGATATTANLTLYTTASGTTAVGGLGSIALPVAACCLAGAGGYMIGNIAGDYIDKKFPDFFDGLFSSVSNFLTGDEHGLAFIFDSEGHAYMPEDASKEIEKYIERSINSYKPSYGVSNNNVNITFKQLAIGDMIASSVLDNIASVSKVTSIECTSPVYAFGIFIVGEKYPNKDAFDTYFVSKEPFNIVHQLEYLYGSNLKPNPGNTECSKPTSYGYYSVSKTGAKVSGVTNGLYSLPINELLYDDWIKNVNKILQKMVNGEITMPDGKPIPTIEKIEVPDKPKIEVPSKYPSWMPVPLPSTHPSKLPNETPDPNSDPDPSKVTPYLPQPQPYPEGVPVPKPDTNPDRNPVVIPDPNPKPSPAPSPELDPSIEPEIVPIPQPDPPPQPSPPAPTPTPVPPLPVIPPIGGDAGLLHVYNPTTAQINEFGKWLWTTFSGDLLDTLAKLFNNPMDAVIGLHELYCTPSTGSSTTIKAGFLDSGVTSRLVSSRYIEINCGAITIPEYWGNYLDYSPYTKVYCYLPFIGIVELNTDDIIGHGVQILYKVDSYNGSCIAMIITAKTPNSEGTTYQFSGNCAVEVPITSGMKSAMQSALIGASTCAIGAAIGGAGVPVIAGMAVNNSLKSGFANKNTVSHSGSFGSSYGAMGIKKPYIIVKRPIQKKVYGYNKKYGYPAHEMVTIGKCSGYLRCRDFDVQSSTATEDEKKLIETLLKQGVYV